MEEAERVPGKPGLLHKMAMGAGYLPRYGEHPGTGTCVMLTLMTGLAGASQGWAGFVGGSALGVLVYGPMWLAGCLGRANDYLRSPSRARAATSED